jgi:hypothetical protein
MYDCELAAVWHALPVSSVSVLPLVPMEYRAVGYQCFPLVPMMCRAVCSHDEETLRTSRHLQPFLRSLVLSHFAAVAVSRCLYM